MVKSDANAKGADGSSTSPASAGAADGSTAQTGGSRAERRRRNKAEHAAKAAAKSSKRPASSRKPKPKTTSKRPASSRKPKPKTTSKTTPPPGTKTTPPPDPDPATKTTPPPQPDPSVVFKVAEQALDGALFASKGKSPDDDPGTTAGDAGAGLDDVSTEDLVALATILYGMPFQLVGMWAAFKARTPAEAKLFLELWQLSEPEVRVGGKALALVVRKHWSTIAAYFPEVVTGVMLTAGIAGRVIGHRMLRAQLEAQRGRA